MSFLRILNLALASPLYLSEGVLNGLRKEGEEGGRQSFPCVPPEFSMQGKSPSFYYAYFGGPERFFRGLVVDEFA